MCGTVYYKACQPPLVTSSTCTLEYIYVPSSGTAQEGDASYYLKISGGETLSISKVRISRNASLAPIIWTVQQAMFGGYKYVNLDPQQFNYVEFLDSSNNLVELTAANCWISPDLVIGNIAAGKMSRVYQR